jgi:hypothetical protein
MQKGSDPALICGTGPHAKIWTQELLDMNQKC